VEGTSEAGFVSGVASGPTSVQVGLDLAPLATGPLQTRAEVEAELDDICTAIRAFHAMEPDHVMRHVAAYSARLTELAVQLVRAEIRDRQYKQLRTLQVERILAELERQFRIASRAVEMRRQDLALLGGAG
jgi:hypothetical protein